MSTDLSVTEDELREVVVDRLKLVTPQDFQIARSMAARLRVPLEYALVQRGHVPLKALLQHLAAQWRVRFIDLKATDVKPEALRRIPEDDARSHMVIAFDLNGGELSVAMADPRDQRTLEELSRLTGLRIVPFLASPDSVKRAQLLYRGNLLEILRHAAATGAPVAAGAVMAYSFTVAYIIAFVIKKTMGIRISTDEEEKGIDAKFHRDAAYELQPA